MSQQKSFLALLIILVCICILYFIHTWYFSVPLVDSVPSQEEIIAEENTVVTAVETSGEFTLADVAQHARKSSCWTIVEDQVYDLTEFASQHTGGEIEILKICGKDATQLFAREHGNETEPTEMLRNYHIGSYLKTE